jgi:hypothetical protein
MLGLMIPAAQALAEPHQAPKKRAPLEIFESSPLVFGTVLAIRGPSKIILHPNGQRQIIGDLDMKPNDPYAPGRLAITGERNNQVRLFFDPKISLWPSHTPPKLKSIGGTVENIILFSNKISKISDVARLNYFGMDTLLIGATLSLSPESPAGTYILTLSPPLEYRGGENNLMAPR